MKEYLKMSDDFKSSDMPMLVEWIAEIKGVGINKALSIMHAINSHDELVEKFQLASKERDEWEARACKEASRVKDLEEFLYHLLAHSHNVDVGGGDFTATT